MVHHLVVNFRSLAKDVERGKVKGERGRGKGKYKTVPLPLIYLITNHRDTEYTEKREYLKIKTIW
ncbi:hypothetical protein FDUTEX481_03104 [Tolypothrix sp. PCC 7601]|nr:hypothetical protein FDUTEX481_03104 [Tolypothrix sp. PCC 7601]